MLRHATPHRTRIASLSIAYRLVRLDWTALPSLEWKSARLLATIPTNYAHAHARTSWGLRLGETAAQTMLGSDPRRQPLPAQAAGEWPLPQPWGTIDRAEKPNWPATHR